MLLLDDAGTWIVSGAGGPPISWVDLLAYIRTGATPCRTYCVRGRDEAGYVVSLKSSQVVVNVAVMVPRLGTRPFVAESGRTVDSGGDPRFALFIPMGKSSLRAFICPITRPQTIPLLNNRAMP